MKNTSKVTYSDIKKLLIANNLNPISNLVETEIFVSLNSLDSANENELTFFNDISQLKKLEKTNAKACLISEEYDEWIERPLDDEAHKDMQFHYSPDPRPVDIEPDHSFQHLRNQLRPQLDHRW